MTHDDLDRLIRDAGPRDRASADREARVRQAARDAWRAGVRGRGRRRWFVPGAMTAAAALVWIVWIVWAGRQTDAPVPPGRAAFGAARTSAVSGTVVREDRSTPASTAMPLHAGDPIDGGTPIRTGGDGLASLALPGGAELRVGSDTRVEIIAGNAIALTRGLIYVDAPDAGTAALAILTPAGVVRDVGTRFEVRVAGAELRVRVRDGAVRVDRTRGRDDVAAGVELVTSAAGPSATRPIRPFGPDWAWVTRAATPFRVEGSTLAALVGWVAREGGWTVAYATPELAAGAAAIALHGSIAGLSTEEALDAVLPTCGLTHRVDAASGRITIARPAGGSW